MIFIVSDLTETEFDQDNFLKQVYIIYSNFLKNPFAEEDQPIKSSKFDAEIRELSYKFP